MDIPRAVQNSQHLPGLDCRAEQRTVAALPFLLALKTDGCTFSKTPHPDDRAIKINRDTAQCPQPKAIQYQSLLQLLEMLNTPGIHCGQLLADDGYIR